MGQVEERAKERVLSIMYRSVARMNSHIVEGSLESAAGEQWLQINLRKNFQELEEKAERHGHPSSSG